MNEYIACAIIIAAIILIPGLCVQASEILQRRNISHLSKKPSSKAEDKAPLELLVQIMKESTTEDRRDSLFNGQRTNDADYGYSTANPIMTFSISKSEKYLENLRTMDGKAFTWNRTGSRYMEELHGVKNVMIDAYQLYLDGSEYKIIYICPYGYSSSAVPQGLQLYEKEKTMEEQIEDDSCYEEEAARIGISVEQLKDLRKLERENAELRRQMLKDAEPKSENTSNAKTENISANNYATNQSILLNLSEESLASATERKYLLRYKNIANLIDEEKKKLQDCSVSTPYSQDETIHILKQIDEYTEQLRILESIYPLRDVLKREKCYQSASKQKTGAIRQPAFENHLNDILNRKTVGDYFEAHYTAALSIAQKSSIAHNPEFELLPAMFVICDYSTASCEKDRHAVADKIMSKITKLCENFNPEKFDQRCNLYGEIIRGKDIRGEWLFGNTDSLSNPISKIAGLLGDILVNPACADNYEEAPVVIYGMSDVIRFSSEVMFPIIDELGQLFKDIYNF